jgi:multiple sugar transport system ATP-binding protein
MRTEIKLIQRRLGSTMIFVTHDQEEALTLGDKIAVMDAGRVQQVGTPERVYNAPVNRFVASFIGSPQINLLKGRLASEGGRTAFRCGPISAPVPEALAARLPTEDLVLGIRPESVSLDGEAGTGLGRVDIVELLGSQSLVLLDVGGTKIRALLQGQPAFREGSSRPYRFDMERAMFFRANGARVDAKG